MHMSETPTGTPLGHRQVWAQSVETYERSVRIYEEASAFLARMRAQLGLSSPPLPTTPQIQRRSIGLVVPATSHPPILPDPTRPLSRREREVAVLVARGCTNAQIARALVITEGTAANHVARIMRKLGVRSRTGIGVWAVERGLVTGGGWIT